MSWNLHQMHKECELLIPEYGDIEILIDHQGIKHRIDRVWINDKRADGKIELMLTVGDEV